MKILIIGASSYLGSRLYTILGESFKTYGTYNKNRYNNDWFFWNTRNYEQLRSIIKEVKPTVIINCIGLADVDLCQVLPEKSYLLNALLPNNLEQICNKYNIKLVHISTDHFENTNDSKLSEIAEPKCMNVYSYSKLSGESLLFSKVNSVMIIRTNFFHFDQKFRNKFINNFFFNISENKPTNGLVDVVFTPISTTMLAESVLKLIALDFSGIINIAANSPISKYDFLTKIAESLGKNTDLVVPINKSMLKLLAPRPSNMSLDNALSLSLLNINVIEIEEMIKQELKWVT